jgi:hypothetical protein
VIRKEEPRIKEEGRKTSRGLWTKVACDEEVTEVKGEKIS